ncbi:DJ-1/PfpI family protein [Paludicola sp. MB14-C6]|uniref:DJ-1/PfpI family protein n=1 Tax=Paludihabitans sp. MB14-C6 TaxID=3070656 RepID=UPI0027DE77E7|nr:DJ-1/PfpI family protein [Paludicola sp. MB14-C6]WMJ23562.1 DJ-1/PfpI family protein [Paludicola sp. MB14-C6]
MKKLFKRFIGFTLCLCLMVSIVCMVGVSDARANAATTQKKVLLIIASKDYEDIELYEPMAILKANGAKVSIASTVTTTAIGSQGRKITPNVKISSVNPTDYDAFAVIGGTGVIGELWDNPDLRVLLQQANEQNKIIAAICAAPPILAKAGLLKGKSATMFPWNEGIMQLTNNGANYVNEEVVVDGNIITGKNPAASKSFGLALCDALKIRKFQKNVLIVIPSKDYEDEELSTSKALLELNGVKVTMTSTVSSATGANGSKYTTDLLISNAVAANYDAIVVIGQTNGDNTLWNSKELLKLLQDAYRQNKIVAAICDSSSNLDKNCLLNNNKGAIFSYNNFIRQLIKSWSRCGSKEVTVIGNIIIGRDRECSTEFGLKICEALKILGR